MPGVDVAFHPEAVAEAAAARAWYGEKSPNASVAFVSELDRAVERIRDASERWPKHLHGTRRYLLRRFPFFVIYRKTPSGPQIVAVAHAKRRPGYWKKR